MKKIKLMARKLFAIIITLVVAFSSMIHVNAAAETIQLGPAKQAGKYIGGVTFSYKFTTDGKYLYCVNMHKNTAQNTSATLVRSGSVIDGGIVYILKNGFPEKSITGDTDKDYYITQTAIWWYLDETTGSQNLGEYFKEEGSDAYNMRHYVKELVQAGVKHRYDKIGVTDTKLKITTSSTEMTLMGDYYYSKDMKISEYQNISKVNLKLENAPQGAEIEVADAHIANTTINVGDTFRVRVPKASVTKDTNIKVVATATGATQYMAYEYHPVKDNMQNVALLEKECKTVSSELTVSIKKEEEIPQSKVTVVKIDANTKQPIAGAVLVLKDSKGTELTRWTSTTSAHVVKNLANGTYTVEEVEAPNGYKLNTNVSRFTIDDKHRDIKINFENAPKKVVVNITKVDQETGQPLAGAVLVIKDVNGEIIYKFTSTTSSEVITDIENGTYTVEELEAHEGYIKNDNIVTFTIDDSHLSHQIVIENAREYYVPDTASATSIIMVILGIVITGFGLKFVYKNGQITK